MFSVFTVLLILCGTSRVSSLCPMGWRIYGTSCYKVYEERSSWGAARVRCESYQGHLVTVKSPEQNNVIIQLTSGFADDQFWIGMYLNKTVGYWLDTYQAVTWSLWRGKGRHTPPDCIRMERAGPWAAVNCSRQHQYICQGDFGTTLEVTTTTQATTLTTLPSTVKRTTPKTRLTTTTTTTTVTKPRPTTTATTTTLAKTDTTTAIFKLQPSTTTAASTTTATTTKATTTMLYLETVTPVRNPGKTYNDNRPSAIGLGSLGVGFLVIVLIGVIMLDASKLARDFKMLQKNLRHFRKCVRKRFTAKRSAPSEPSDI